MVRDESRGHGHGAVPDRAAPELHAFGGECLLEDLGREPCGVVDAPGLYAIGLPVIRRRKSTFIQGAEDEARDVTDHMSGYLAHTGTRHRA